MIVDTDRMITLEQWSTCYASGDIYDAPEVRGTCLNGIVTDHPRFDGSSKVTTTRVVEVNGRIVTTRSGSVYKLGTIDPEYREWLRENRPEWDYKNPIVML